MERHFEEDDEAEVRKRALRAQRIIVVTMIVFAVLPFLVAWISGSLRF